MNAVILAGGFGSRLKPLTDSTPKPMLPIANVPMLDYVISHLHASGINDTVLTLGYYPEQITEWISGYSGLRARHVVENVPLGTAGGVRAAMEELDDTFIVVSGDALENIDYAAMLKSHKASGKLITMAVTRVRDPRMFGLVEYAPDGTVTGFTEKPSDMGDGGIVNCGVYIISRAALKYVPYGEKYDFARDLFPRLVVLGQINAYFHDGFWSDIGSPQAYYEANFRMLKGGFFPLVPHRYRTVSRRVGSEKNSLAAYSALLTGRCLRSIVGEGAAVASDANIEGCVVLAGVTVRGFHYREIIGDGYSLPLATDFVHNQHDSADISKNFS